MYFTLEKQNIFKRNGRLGMTQINQSLFCYVSFYYWDGYLALDARDHQHPKYTGFGLETLF